MHELPFRGQSFDPEEWSDAGSCAGLSDWKCAEKEASCPRGPMVRDLLRTHLLIGETTHETATALMGLWNMRSISEAAHVMHTALVCAVASVSTTMLSTSAMLKMARFPQLGTFSTEIRASAGRLLIS